MKPRERTALILVVGVVFAALLIYRLRPGGVIRKSSTPPTPRSLADSAWPKPESHGSPTTKPGKVDPSARRADADWASLFASSHDFFAFVKGAAGPAFRGNGAAALYVSRAVEVCQLEVALYGHAPDPRAAFENWLSEQVYAPEPEVARAQRNFDLCKGFFSGNAFASLPPRKGGYLSFPYWLNAADTDGNPIAEVIHVANELPAIGNGQNRRTAAEAQATLIGAVSTGDPEAVFRTGLFLLGGHGANVTDAFALAIAGCDLGYDCSADNSLIFGRCAELGTCATGLDFQDWATQAIGPSAYAQAYAVAQQLEAAIAQGDTAAISGAVALSK